MRIVWLVMMVPILFSAASCRPTVEIRVDDEEREYVGASSSAQYLGTYKRRAPWPMKREFSVVLKSDGTGSENLSGEFESFRWRMEGAQAVSKKVESGRETTITCVLSEDGKRLKVTKATTKLSDSGRSETELSVELDKQ